jgi:ribosome-associated protein
MIKITTHLSIDESEIEEKFVHASGPGGQNINKVATAVQLRFSIEKSPSLPEDVKLRLIKVAGNLVTKEGDLVILARRYRTQEANRRDAVDRLTALIRKALIVPRRRIKTSPSKASKLQRLAEKKRRGEKKKARQAVKYPIDD